LKEERTVIEKKKKKRKQGSILLKKRVKISVNGFVLKKKGSMEVALPFIRVEKS
jgi:hypothetical protein